MKKFCVAAMLAVLFLCVNVMSAQTLVCDRGLPTANLNNAAGSLRSNVAWSFGNDWISGDDCTIGTAGETWVVTKVTGWSVQGAVGTMPLGDRFQTVNLYLGVPDSALNMVSSGNLTLGNNVNSNSSIVHAPVAYTNGQNYQGTSGSWIQIWQHDFSNLAFVISGGTKLRFAGDGTLREGGNYYWFNHASNAGFSGLPLAQQQGADGLFLGWARTDLVNPFFCDSGNAATCGGWDKSSDLNVQIYAVKLEDGMATGGGWFIPETLNSVGLANDGSKATFGFVAKSKNAAATGNLEFHYNASGINLNSSSLEWVQVATGQAMFEGLGTINGTGAFKYRVRVVDSTADRFEIRIWTTGGSFDGPLYRAEGNLGGGQIVVHKK